MAETKDAKKYRNVCGTINNYTTEEEQELKDVKSIYANILYVWSVWKRERRIMWNAAYTILF